MKLHDVLIHLFSISDPIRADCALEHGTTPGYKAFEQSARWFAVRIMLAEDVTQVVERGGTVAILEFTVSGR